MDGLIIGGGPTGLTLGCELIKRGLKVRLIEKLPQATDQSRALALQSRTLEIFERMGILDRFLKEGRIIHRGNFNHNHKLFASIDFAALQAPYPFILVVPQSETEKILADHFENLGGEIERGVSLQELLGEEAVLNHATGRIEKTSARWIFGCDGAHSEVRHSLNLPFKGAAFPETFALADVEMQIDLPQDQAHFYSYRSHVCGLIPLTAKNEFRIIVIGAKKQQVSTDLPFFHHFVKICSGLPLEIKRTSWTSIFTIHRRITSKMRVGNIFLLGDAAHIHSPAGGQGLNTSVQDAFNLGWKIALIHHNKAHKTLLDSFEQERFPAAKDVLRYTTLATKIISSRLLKAFLFPVFSHLSKKPFVQKYLTRSVSELNLSYHNSPIIAKDRDTHWKGPKPGERAPDAILADHRRLFQLLSHPLHTLVCFGDRQFEPLLEKINLNFPQTIRTVQISQDLAGEATEIYHTSLPCYYLIRPDGVISYRSRSLDPDPFFVYLAKIFK
ncbi:MAG: FAD-dependent monooxygenase [Rhabdochlamydiaceae bacterium]